MELVKRDHERRRKHRFSIEREVRYKMADGGVVVASGSGTTLNMGSGGIAFTAEQQLPPGGYVELSVSWPALLADTCPMRFIVFGRIVRSSGSKAVCTIDKYEFRTQARSLAVNTEIRSDGKLQRWADGMRKETLKTNAAGA